MKRVILVVLPIMLLASFFALRWLNHPNANRWLDSQGRQADKIEITAFNWDKRIGLSVQEKEGVIISDSQTIHQLFGLLNCSGTLTNPSDERPTDFDYYQFLNLVVTTNGKTEHLTLFQREGSFRLVRARTYPDYYPDPPSPYQTLGVCSVQKQSVSVFLNTLRSLIAQSRLKKNNIEIFEVQGH